MDGELHRMRMGQGAVDRARGRKRYRDVPGCDFVLLDFADADERHLTAVAEIAFTRRKKQPPTVLLMGPESQQLLATSDLAEAAARLFAPLGLFEFLSRAREHGTERFLGALRIIGKIGPVLVQLPGFVADCSKQQSDTQLRRAIEQRVA